MSLKETATIAFSSALAGSPLARKQEALIDLLDYIEFSNDIETIDKNGGHILESIYSLFVSFVEGNNLAQSYRVTIAIRDLSLEDTSKISKMGFDVYASDGQRLTGS